MRIYTIILLIFIIITAIYRISIAQPGDPFEPDKYTLGLWHFDFSEPDCLWSATFGGERIDIAYRAILSRDGDYLIGGDTRSFGAGSSEFLLVKMNTNGEVIWSRAYGSPQRLICYDLVQLENGDIAMTGTLDLPAPRADFMLMLIAENGDSLWSRTYGDDGIRNCKALVATDDGGFLLGGTANDQRYDNEIWIVKTDAEGEVEWTESYGTDEADVLFDLESIPDEGYLLAGSWYNDRIPNAYIAEIDTEGEIIWERFGGDRWGSFCASIIITEDGYIGTGNAGRDPWIVCLDNDGDINWSFYYGAHGASWQRSVKSFDRGYVIAGTFDPPDGRYNFGLAKMTHDRERGWNKDYGGENWEYGYDVILNKDGSYTIFGRTDSFGAGENDVWVVRTNPDLSPTTDVSGLFNSGGMVGEVEIVEGRWGNAIYLPSDSGGYMVVQDAEQLHPEEFTIEGWFLMSNESEHTGAIITKMADEERHSYALYASSDENEIVFILNTEERDYQVNYETEPDNNEWHYIVGSYDNTIMRLFYDGDLAAENEVGEAVLYGDGPLIIGNAEENTGGEFQFYGLIDEVRLSNIPVWSMTPLLIVSADTLNFELINVDSSVILELEVANSGNSMAVVDIAGPDEVGAFIWEEFNDFELVRGDTMVLDVIFSPNQEGNYCDWITIGYQEGEFEIFLTGSGYVDVIDNDAPHVMVFDMLQATPNPFNSVVRLNYALSQMNYVRLAVYDLSGHKVALLVDNFLKAGSYSSIWDATEISSGIYFAHLSTPVVTIITKMTLIK